MDVLTEPTRLVDPAPASLNPARYLAIWAATLATLLIVNIALCVFADPYAILGTPPIAGLTARKPAAAAWPRLSKPTLVARVQPTTLIIGSSTTDIGFDPDCHAWPPTARPVFNFGIDGALPETQLRFLQHALAVSHPTRIIIAANFVDSVSDHAPAATEDFDARLRARADGSPNPGYARGRLADLVFATLSFTATLDSLSTLFSQHEPDATIQTAAGWNTGAVFRRWVRQDGAFALFLNKDREKIPQFRRWTHTMFVQTAQTIAMVRAARDHGAQVTLLILPNHTDEMEALHQLGLDQAAQAWKTALFAALPDTTIWDFSGATPYTTEALPAPSDRTTQLRWFWEPIHFKSELGDLMIARIFGAPGDFGVRGPADAGLSGWETAHLDDVRRIAGLTK